MTKVLAKQEMWKYGPKYAQTDSVLTTGICPQNLLLRHINKEARVVFPYGTCLFA